MISLPKEIAHYLSNVLRLRADDELLVFNSEQGEFLARVTSVAKLAVDIELVEKFAARTMPLSKKLSLFT